jgi:hypothetical protein
MCATSAPAEDLRIDPAVAGHLLDVIQERGTVGTGEDSSKGRFGRWPTVPVNPYGEGLPILYNSISPRKIIAGDKQPFAYPPIAAGED